MLRPHFSKSQITAKFIKPDLFDYTKGISLIRLLGTHETEMFQVLKKMENRQQAFPCSPIL
ncbi:MAG: hypothetical protein CV080_09855 [Candidatus Kuenenia stuttgartiensis]|nr:MAG: hypothetical protein CV080_09855 [Candidatus Kuenenia stuttgartiensis]